MYPILDFELSWKAQDDKVRADSFARACGVGAMCAGAAPRRVRTKVWQAQARFKFGIGQLGQRARPRRRRAVS